MTPPSVLAGLLASAAATPDRPAFTFLDWDHGKGGGTTLSYAELLERSSLVAARIEALGLRGERVVLACPSSLEYVPAFYGIMLAGAVPVPVHTPPLVEVADVWPRIASIVRDAGASWAVVPRLPEEPDRRTAPPGFRGWLQLDELAGAAGAAGAAAPGAETAAGPAAERWPLPAPDDLAFLQYTSGSTGHPKGVMVTHACLVHNSEAVAAGVGADRDTTVVTWLPLFHDMGIIGSLISPLYWGAHVVTMSPQAFAADPVRWLRAIGEYRGQLSYTPNFGLELCLRKVSDAQLAELDLSSWRHLLNASEPIRESSMRRFAERFAAAGFDGGAAAPAYGLAESTLIVSLRRWEGPREVVPLDGRPYVNCGPALSGLTVRIVDPVTGRPCPDGESGEIWVAGPSVAAGYWQRPDATDATFHGRLPGDPVRYLRTGDLGMLAEGEVVVVGRHKDLIIINGVNHYPQDLEYTAEQVSPAVRGGRCAAFATEPTGDVPQSEAAVLVAEVRRGVPVDHGELITDIRLAVAREHQVLLDGVFLVGENSVPKTTSGKIQRRGSRETLLGGGFGVLAGWVSPALSGLTELTAAVSER